MSTVMTDPFGVESGMRQRGEWMRPSDDVILEVLYEYGNLTPQAVARAGGPALSTAQNRLPVLRDYGPVTNVFNVDGLYRLTDDGRDYLRGDLDASSLDPE